MPYMYALYVCVGMAGLLPNAHAELMEPGKSGISDAFPDKFQIDMDGKNWEWEAVVLIPFLDEARLMDETSRINASALTPQQRARNEHGLNKRYMYQPHAPLETPLRTEQSPLGSALPPLEGSRVAWHLEDFKPYPPDRPRFTPVLCKGVSLGPNACAGYPSLFSRPLHVPTLTKANLEIFSRRSRRESLCLRFADTLPLSPSLSVSQGLLTRADPSNAASTLPPPPPLPLEAAGRELVGQECWVSWPYWRSGVVVAVCDGVRRVGRDGQGGVSVRALSASESSAHQRVAEAQHAEWLQVCVCVCMCV